MPIVTIKKCLNCDIAHEWLFDGITLKEQRLIKALIGMNGKEFAAAGDDLDPDALTALLYILHKRDKITVPFEDIDLNFNDFTMEPTDEERAQIEKLEAEMKAKADEAQAPKIGSGPTLKAA
jgi:hypothetical protein